MNYLRCFLLIIITSPVFSQDQVTLSSLNVTEIMESSSGELNNFRIELSVSAPASLDRLEIILQEGTTAPSSSSQFFSVIVKEGKAELDMKKYTVPFEGNSLRFYLKVRDQHAQPYHKILVKGYTKNNQETNQLVYNRLN